VLISSLNSDGSTNIAPMSSAWWVGNTAMLGLSVSSQTVRNLQRRPRLVLNLVDASMVDAVDRLALLTGRPDVPDYKRARGYTYQPDKYRAAGLTPVPFDSESPAGVAESLIHPLRWHPLIMKFTEYFTGGDLARPSSLARGWDMPELHNRAADRRALRHLASSAIPSCRGSLRPSAQEAARSPARHCPSRSIRPAGSWPARESPPAALARCHVSSALWQTTSSMMPWGSRK
jgi:hypothetical protein